MNPYPAYNESGVPWLGEVPGHWKLSKIKYIADFSPKCTKRDLAPDDIVGYAPMECIKQGYFMPRSIQCQRLPAALVPFDEGDIVMAKVTPCFENGNIAIMEHLPNGIGFGSSELFVLRSTGILKYFLFYWLQNPLFKGAAASTMTGAGGLKRVSPTFVRDSRIPIPPLEEQAAIAAYLDEKCAQIDELVARRQGIIEKLRELKQAIIAQTVTKGLNPHVPMKDSGVDWLGELPGHWDCRKLGALFNERRTKVSDKEYEPLSVARIGIVPQLETAVKTDAGDNRKLVCAGDFVINSRSDRKGSCGVASRDGSVSLINTVLTPRKMWDAKYVHHLLKSRPFSEEYYRYGRGIVADLWTTRFSEMKSIYLPIPPLEEQAAIAAYLDEKCTQIDELILRHERTVEKLKELRAATIAEVVTGKVDVRKETKQQIT